MVAEVVVVVAGVMDVLSLIHSLTHKSKLIAHKRKLIVDFNDPRKPWLDLIHRAKWVLQQQQKIQTKAHISRERNFRQPRNHLIHQHVLYRNQQ